MGCDTPKIGEIFSDYQKALAYAETKAWTVTGTSYVLVMDLLDGRFAVHPYSGQPCYGELRKYKQSHGNEYTQHDDYRPGDLYDPFPVGSPTALFLPFGQALYDNPQNRLVLSEFFTEKSPWLRGFGNPENVSILENKGKLCVFLSSLFVDPTVMVQMIWTLRRYCGGLSSQYEAVRPYLTPEEAHAYFWLGGQATTFYGHTDAYHFAPAFSARRYFDQNPRDLSGGYFTDRIDYNRKQIQDLFLADKGKHCVLQGVVTGSTTKELCESASNAFKEAYEKEGEYTNPPFKFPKGCVLFKHPNRETTIYGVAA